SPHATRAGRTPRTAVRQASTATRRATPSRPCLYAVHGTCRRDVASDFPARAWPMPSGPRHRVVRWQPPHRRRTETLRLQARIERITQAVANQVEAEDRQEDGEARERAEPGA